MSGTSITIASRIIKTELINWRLLEFIQEENFKELPENIFLKLKTSILQNQFAQPFYVWQDPSGKIYCLDGKHRTRALEALAGEGHNIPDQLPATYIQCESIQEAAKLVLIYSSQYAKITDEGFKSFIELYEFDIESILQEISIPVMTVPEEIDLPLPPDLEGDAKNKPATMKITFETHKDLEAAMPFIDQLIEEKFPNAFFSVSCGEI